MKSLAERHASDMFKSLVRGDPRQVFTNLKRLIVDDFTSAYESGASNSEFNAYPIYELSMQDQTKLHLLLQQSVAAGKAAYEIAQLQLQIAGDKA